MNKKFKKKIVETLAPPILYVLISLLYFTCKKNFHYDKGKIKEEPSLFVFWHGELMMLPFAYERFRGRKSIDSVISEHSDGEVASKFIKLLGGGTIRGSSTRGGIKALKAVFQSLALGRDVGITPDGPKGPRHSVSSGVVLISQKKKTPIVAMNVQATSCWRFESWDKFFIPKPFSTLDFYFSEPFYVEGLEEEDAKEVIRQRLMQHAF